MHSWPQAALSFLDEVSRVLRDYTDTRVNVAGHTDSTGNADYNQRLCERRARSVSHYLNQKGVSASRLEVRGYGETQPVASNDNEQGRAQNRRVEITLTPTEAAGNYQQP